ncbi:MAG TPA: galactokinase, partial [Clostridiales bacterium]|nr:galactokinase [Clostridiales bacterium]
RLVITDTGGNHAALSGEYATIPGEMKEVAAFFNKSVLRDVTQEAVMANMAAIRA